MNTHMNAARLVQGFSTPWIRALAGVLAAVGLAVVLGSCGGSSGEPVAETPEATAAPAEPEETEPEEAEPEETEPEEAEPEETEPQETEPEEAEPEGTEPEEASSEEAEPEPGTFVALDEFVAGVVTQAGLEGAGIVVVDQDAGIVHESYAGSFGPERVSMIASTSKMISAGILMRLDDDGLLDADAPLTEAVEWAGDHPEMTAAQLVSNSSGLVGLFPDVLYAPYICQWMPTETLQGCAETVLTTTGDDGLVVEPDTEFRYGGAQWQVAGGVAEAVSGKSWDQLLDEVYRQPCGVDSLGYLSLGQVNAANGYPVDFAGDPNLHDATDNPNIEGGAYIEPGDYAKLLLMHLRGGMCDGTQVLSQDALDTMHGDRVGEAYEASPDVDTGYGMGWWVDRASGLITDPGAWGAMSWLNLDEGYGAYWIIEDTSSAVTQAVTNDLIAIVHWELTGEDI